MGLSAGKAQTDRGGPVDHKGSGERGRHIEHMFWVASGLVKLKSESVDDRTTVLGVARLARGCTLRPSEEEAVMKKASSPEAHSLPTAEFWRHVVR